MKRDSTACFKNGMLPSNFSPANFKYRKFLSQIKQLKKFSFHNQIQADNGT